MKIILHGYTGHMGRLMEELISWHPEHEVAAEAAFDCPEETGNCFRDLNSYTGEADVLIDFSNHVCTESVVSYCRQKGIPAVICTTGQTEEEKAMIADAGNDIPVFFSANMSLGIAVLGDLAKKAASMFPDADIEIVEKHHNRKLDVPSGTALMLADRIKEVRENAVYNIGRHEYGKRTKEEIGILSLRMGNEAGTHEIYINTGNECITLTHEANSRAVFADGALKAAEWLVQQNAGVYSMKDLLG